MLGKRQGIKLSGYYTVLLIILPTIPGCVTQGLSDDETHHDFFIRE